MKPQNNRKIFGRIFILAITGIFVLSFSVFSEMGHAKGEKRQFRQGQVIVKFKQSKEIYRIKTDLQIDIEKLSEEFALRPDVEWAEPNYLFSASGFPNDPEYLKQWYLESIRARDAWSAELTIKTTRQFNRESIIAILDTGVYLDHPDLKDNIWINMGEVPGDSIDNDRNGFIDDVNGWDFLNDNNDPNPKFDSGYMKDAVNHGTIVAGIAGAGGNNSVGIAGISWKVKIMPLRVLNSSGDGDVYDVYRAVNYAIKNKANVINMSFVGDDESALLHDIIKKAYDSGILVVVAAGNTDPDQIGKNLQNTRMYPVCTDVGSDENFVIGVASLGKAGTRSGFSNYGDDCVDISAPGEGFYGTQSYNSSIQDFSSYYGGYWSGTSLSAPLVSGTLALVKSVRPDLNNEQLVEALLKGADKIDEEGLGAGKLNIYNSLTYAMQYKIGEPGRKSTSHLVIAGLGFESFPQIKVLKDDFSVFKSFFAYGPTFKGSVNVATGDVDGDGVADIVTGAGMKGGPHIRVMDIDGHVKSQFFAFDSKSSTGVNIALGDIDGDKIDEIITAPGKKQKPIIRIYKYNGTLLGSFLAYSENFLGGVNVAAGDTNGDGKDDIVTGAGQGGGPHVRIFNGAGELLGQFFAFNRESRSGIRVAVGDINQDIFDEIIVAPESKASPIVRIFRTTNFGMISEFSAFNPNYFYGLNITVGDYNTDGKNEILVGAGTGGNADAQIFDWKGNLEKQFLVHPNFYKGGVRMSIMEYSL